MTPEMLDSCVGCGLARATAWAPAFTAAMERFQINTSRRQAAFLAQVAHESGLFAVIVENLNYSAHGLIETFPKHFATQQEAESYAYKAQAIANRVYANRMGNGDELSGDGWNFRGRGPLQTTGRDSYRDFGSLIGFDLVPSPDMLIQPSLGALAAGWEWGADDLNSYADAGDTASFEKITRAINGGLLGEPDRLALYGRALRALGL